MLISGKENTFMANTFQAHLKLTVTHVSFNIYNVETLYFHYLAKSN